MVGGLNNYHISTSMLTPGLQLQLFVHLGVWRTGRQGQILLRSLTFQTMPTHSSVAIRGHACLPAWPSPLLLCTNILATRRHQVKKRRSHSYTECNLVIRSIILDGWNGNKRTFWIRDSYMRQTPPLNFRGRRSLRAKNDDCIVLVCNATSLDKYVPAFRWNMRLHTSRQRKNKLHRPGKNPLF
jgi:hypothetical protein